jgi:hypothetical protein
MGRGKGEGGVRGRGEGGEKKMHTHWVEATEHVEGKSTEHSHTHGGCRRRGTFASRFATRGHPLLTSPGPGGR